MLEAAPAPDAVRQAASVVGELRSLSRAQQLAMDAVDLSELLESSLSLLRVSPGHDHIKVARELAVGLPALRLDARKMEQVFINLMMNAIHAMPGGGTLTARTSVKQVGSPHMEGAGDPQTGLRFSPGDAVIVVDIDDAGHGIPNDKLSMVFESFSTTKAEGKGIGLGLTVCKTIVGLHGGVLALSNLAKGGVRASIMFKVD